MILKIFTIFDVKAGAYLPPFYLPQTAMAVRTFADCIKDPEHSFGKHPEDYTLMAIGSFDDMTALAITTPPESLGNGLEFKVEIENLHQDLVDGPRLQEKISRFGHPDLFDKIEDQVEKVKGNSK